VRTSRIPSSRIAAAMTAVAFATVTALVTIGVSAPSYADSKPASTSVAGRSTTLSVSKTSNTVANSSPIEAHRAHEPKAVNSGHPLASIAHSSSLNKAAAISSDSAPFVASSAGTVTVDGHIYFGSTATPAAGVVLLFCEIDNKDTLGGQCYSGYTNSSGEIASDAEHPNTLVVLPASVDYRMQVQNLVNPQFQISEFVPTEPGVTCVEQPTDGCAFSTVANVTGADAIIPAASTISGTVTNDGGTALSGINVYLDQYLSGKFTEYEQKTTAADGTFTFGGVPDGDYAIEYVDSTGAYAYQSFSDESQFYLPDLITVTGAGSLTGAGAKLHLGSAISGTVSYPGGSGGDFPVNTALSPLSAEIQVFDGVSQSWVDTGYSTLVAQSGYYTLTGLAPDTYRVRFDYSGHATSASVIGTPVTVSSGGQTLIDNAVVTIIGLTSTDSSIDTISGSKAGVSVAGWAVWPQSDSTSVGVAVNIGSSWYGLMANQASTEVVPDEAYRGITVGPNHGFSGTIAVAPGTYNACIWVTEQAWPAVNVGCHTVTVPAAGATVAKISTVAGSLAGVTIAGYALFPDNDTASVNVALNVGSNWYGTTANVPNSQAQTDVPGAGPNHGFQATFAVAPGNYSACVWVSEPSGSAVNTGCQTVVVPVPARTTYGLDSLTGSAAGVSVAGWALFPDSPSAAVNVAVNIGAGWFGFTANQSNTDAGSGTNHGYSGTIPVAPGTYNACVWVSEPTGPALNTGCQSVVVPAPARTTYGLDSLTGTATGVSVAGWALFPDSPSASATVALNIGSGWYGFTANQPNTDSGAGSNHGYAGSVPLPPGIYNVCVWVTEPSGPAVNTGCHSVAVAMAARTTFGLDSLAATTTGVTVAGWALYPDSPSTSVTVALNIGSGWYGFTANQPNRDAGAGTNHGYAGSVALAPGTYTACVWVTEPTGPAVNTGCQSLTVVDASSTTFGLDSVTPNTTGVTVAGWAQYPLAPATSVTVALNIGANWYGFTANQANSDSGAGTNHGYTATVPLLNGTYNVCVWVSEPSGPSLNTGCHTVTVTSATPPAVAVFESAISAPGGINIQGYSEFPGSPSTPVSVAAQIGSNWYGITANGNNIAVPGHGFNTTIPVPHGTYTVCMWTTEPIGPPVEFGCLYSAAYL